MIKSFDDFERFIDSPEMEVEKDRIYLAAYEADKQWRESAGEDVSGFAAMSLMENRATAAVSRFELRKYHEWING